MPYHCHVFVDGGYLRKIAEVAGAGLLNPHLLAQKIVQNRGVQGWGNLSPGPTVVSALTRVRYYDARPDDPSRTDKGLQSYWSAVEQLPDTELAFGSLRGQGSQKRQKGVDTLIAIDMVVGAFTGLFQIAVLIAGDADFVPAVREVRRRGVAVVLAADESSSTPFLSDDLRRAVDRFVPIGKAVPGMLPTLKNSAGREWSSVPSKK